MLDNIDRFLSGYVLVPLLLLSGILMTIRLSAFFFFHPIKFFKDLLSSSKDGETSSFSALTTALAGTLGVGNISGVCAAIISGGPGALFWMVVSAFAVMSIKYAEVFLAVEFRMTLYNNEGRRFYRSGAPYYIREGLRPRLGKFSSALAVLFAVLLISNSLLTGTLVQVNAAASVSPFLPRALVGALFGGIALFVVFGGMKRVGHFTSFLIPLLSAVFISMSLWIIIRNRQEVPRIMGEIMDDAFHFRAAKGGILGFLASRAVRFGVTRGIFSNEAGCGSSPTAHGAADSKSPHHQGCFGIFEVFCDTVVMCSLCGLVVLVTGASGTDGMALAIDGYGAGGKLCSVLLSASILIFALSTVVCQCYYGTEALLFLSNSRFPRTVYHILVFAAAVWGSVISADLMWQIADLQISLMTVINTLAVLALSKRVIKGFESEWKTSHPKTRPNARKSLHGASQRDLRKNIPHRKG